MHFQNPEEFAHYFKSFFQHPHYKGQLSAVLVDMMNGHVSHKVANILCITSPFRMQVAAYWEFDEEKFMPRLVINSAISPIEAKDTSFDPLNINLTEF